MRNVLLVMNATILPVLTVLFIQLALLALPLVVLYGKENPPAETEELRIEVTGAQADIDWRAVDLRITVVGTFRDPTRNSISYELDVPRHRPFTEALKKIATHVAGAKLLSVSRQTEVCVELIVKSEDDSAWIRGQSGCELNYSFTYPSDGSQHVAATVQTYRLLAFIHNCESRGIAVAQIFDFLE